MTAQENVAALLARIGPVLPEKCEPYDLGKVPSPRPSEFVELALTRRFGGSLNLAGSMSVVGYRFTIAAVSQASIANARNSLEKCRAELEFSRLVVAGKTSTPIQFETEDEADYGSGWFSQYAAFTYAL